MWLRYPAFTDINQDCNYELFSLTLDGRHHIRLTHNSADDGYISWAPDGTLLCFMSNRDGHYEIYRMNQDGSRVVRLTYNGAKDTQPSWSPF